MIVAGTSVLWFNFWRFLFHIFLITIFLSMFCSSTSSIYRQSAHTPHRRWSHSCEIKEHGKKVIKKSISNNCNYLKRTAHSFHLSLRSPAAQVCVYVPLYSMNIWTNHRDMSLGRLTCLLWNNLYFSSPLSKQCSNLVLMPRMNWLTKNPANWYML